ncbi:MAG TPA: MFS transporter [Jatrophihabitans sp.]
MSIWDARFRLSTVGIVIVITMFAFEGMAVAAALPSAARDLHAVGSFGWTFTGFLIASIVGMVVCGQVSDSRGPRLPLLAGLVLFVAGLAVSGAATDMPMLVLGRFVQGLGGGLLITVVYVVIGQVYPEQLHPKVFAATSTAWVVPSLIGPFVSGLLAQHASWRWVFLGLIPVGLIGCVLMAPVLRSLHEPDQRAATKNVLHYAVAVAVAIAILERVGQNPPAVWLLVLAIVVALALLAWSLPSLVPTGTLSHVLPARFRRNARTVSGPVAMRALLSSSFFGVESLIPLMMQTQHGYGATLAGVCLTSGAITWAAGSWWQGHFVAGDDIAGRKRLIRIGFACVMVSAVLVAVVSQLTTNAWLIFPVWGIAGIGAGLTMSSFGVLLLRFTTDEERGADSASLQLADTTSTAITTGFAGILVAAAARGSLGYSTAFTVLDIAMAVVATVGLLAAGRVAPREATEPLPATVS